MNHPKDLASEIEAQFACPDAGLLRDSAASARMRVLEEERNAAVLEAERARKERDCAMAREKVALEQPVCEYRAKFHDECRRTAEQIEAWCAERDRLKAERDQLKAERDRLKAIGVALGGRVRALEDELRFTRAERHKAVTATAEARNMLADLEASAQEAACLLATERAAHEVALEALVLTSGALNTLSARISAALDAADAAAKGKP